jgi:hypothetical protein
MQHKEAALRHYRLYGLKDGRIISTTVFDAADDIAAVEAARARSALVDSELWCGSRLVAFVPATPDPE